MFRLFESLMHVLCKTADLLFWACIIFAAPVLLFSVTVLVAACLMPILLP